MKVTAMARPFILSSSDGPAFLITSEEAQRVLDAKWRDIARVSAVRVVFADATILQPATTGGGPAFKVEN